MSDSNKAKVSLRRLIVSSLVGSILSVMVILIISFFIISNVSSTDEVVLKPNSVLRLNLDGALPELSNNVGQDIMSGQFNTSNKVGLSDLCRLIDKAAEDDNIKGIFIDPKQVSMGWSTAKVLRDKLIDFKESGKFIVAYSTMFSQRSYYLASVADELYIHPEGGFSFMGMASQLMYFKGLMDKLGVKAKIFYAGKFKSATEPFRRKDMTPENRKQVSAMLRGMYDLILEDLSESRSISKTRLFEIADSALIREPADAVELAMFDAIKYRDEVLDGLKEKLGTRDDDKIETVSINTLMKVYKDKLLDKTKEDKVAIVYAEGNIVDGKGDQGSIGGDTYAGIIRKLRKKPSTKVIVLRVNSGGGSALASDLIWRELAMAKEAGIKVVTSMGDVAASGGYYIAANSDRIFAEKSTITGSIGVFGMIPNMTEMFEEKLGITFDTVKIGRYAMMQANPMFYEFNSDEEELIQTSVDETYMTFKEKVSEGRGLDIEYVDSIAQGRVWLGQKALNIGLVDEMGGLASAIEYGVEQANLGEYGVVEYPKAKSLQEKIAEILSGDSEEDDKVSMVSAILLQQIQSSVSIAEWNELQHVYRQVNQMKGVQMRMPYFMNMY